MNNYKNEFGSLHQYQQMPLNPGIRQWAHTAPHEYHYTGDRKMISKSFVPVNTPAELKWGGYIPPVMPIEQAVDPRDPYNQMMNFVPPESLSRKVEGFSQDKMFFIIKVLMLIFLIYIIMKLVKKNM